MGDLRLPNIPDAMGEMVSQDAQLRNFLVAVKTTVERLASEVQTPVVSKLSDFPDYESGDWIPRPTDQSGNTAGFTQSIGQYTKVGNIIHATWEVLGIDTTGLTATNSFVLRDLPFKSIPGGIGAIGAAAFVNTTLTGIQVISYIFDSFNSSIVFFEINSGGNATGVAISQLTSGTAQSFGSITYLTSQS